MDNYVTPQLLSGIAGVLLSLVFEYVPGLRDWYNKQTDNIQKLIMLLALAIVAGSLYGLACTGYLSFIAPSLSLACTQQGLLGLLTAFISALIANQSTYVILPRK